MSIWASTSSCIPRIVSPPLPMIMPICDGSIWIVWMRGAYSDSSPRGASMTLAIYARVKQLAARRLDDLGHLAEDELARLVGLGQRVAQDVEGDTRDLDVHLQRGDAAV